MATGHFSLKVLGCVPMKDFSESRDDAKLYNFYLSESALKDKQLTYLAKKYLVDIVKNSTMLVRQQKKTGRTETQSFEIKLSKPIIDEIDELLAQHYGFTEEELDFIINYDIKYRMGDELNAEE